MEGREVKKRGNIEERGGNEKGNDVEREKGKAKKNTRNIEERGGEKKGEWKGKVKKNTRKVKGMKTKRGKSEKFFLGRRKGEGKRRGEGGNSCCVMLMRE